MPARCRGLKGQIPIGYVGRKDRLSSFKIIIDLLLIAIPKLYAVWRCGAARRQHYGILRLLAGSQKEKRSEDDEVAVQHR